MYPEILHLYGPFSIHSYGLMIALGVITFVWTANRHPLRKKYMSSDALMDLVIMGTFWAVAGGRLLYVLTQWHTLDNWSDLFNVWQGGLSLLGSVLACGIFAPLYLWRHHIPVLPCLDLIGINAPLLQSISRIGCFLAGCCYGRAFHSGWLDAHPTQLYSAALLLMIFFTLRWVYNTKNMHQGQFFALYLIMSNAERFCVDFFRGDQEFYSHSLLGAISIHQWIALTLLCLGLIGFGMARRTTRYGRPL
ncbi:prolipoprotein diacylglyceryl transferase [Candidatus Dependentiae bacterium]|nr:prolipoprotein diacylglyceryl transferase [Candidatus Dependentiae bacterium]MCC7415349.1 prolipoprotein diacylglyceryl transferase [Campylobacterota bacterium]